MVGLSILRLNNMEFDWTKKEKRVADTYSTALPLENNRTKLAFLQEVYKTLYQLTVYTCGKLEKDLVAYSCVCLPGVEGRKELSIFVLLN